MTVIDASAAVALLLRTSPLAVEEAALGDPAGLRAPELLDLEVLSALRRAERGGELTATRLAQALDDLAVAVPELFPVRPLMARIAELRANVSPYDAAYVALAELLDAPLLTSDRRLASALSGQSDVVVLGG